MKAQLNPPTLKGTLPAIASKSFAHRLLMAAALADKPTTVYCPLRSEDILATARVLTSLGAEILDLGDRFEVTPIASSERGIQTNALLDCGESEDILATARVLTSLGAEILDLGDRFEVTPIASSERGIQTNALLDCGESGTTERFILPIVGALGHGGALTGHGRLPQRPLSPLYEVLVDHGLKLSPQGTFPLTVEGQGALGHGGALTGHGRLPQRPLSPLYEVLVDHGLKLSPQGTFPLTVEGQLTAGKYTMAGNVSSQFVGGLLFALSLTEGTSTLTLTETIESAPYIRMTLDVLRLFGVDR